MFSIRTIHLLLILISLFLYMSAAHAFLLRDDLPATASLKERRLHKLGKAYMYSLAVNVRILHDPLIQTYLDHLGQRLANASNDPNRRYYFFVIDAPSLNAFTGPDARIAIHSGLFLQTESENELASVLAHEMGHVTEKHIEHLLAQENAYKVSAVAGMAAAIALSTVNPEMGMGALMATQAGLQNRFLKFSRKNESAADRAALKTLVNAGFDPRGMITLLKKMSEHARYHPELPPEYLLTHPHEITRIADSLNRLNPGIKSLRPEDPEFHLVKERVRVLSSLDQEALLRNYHNNLQKDPQNLALHYGFALALLKVMRFGQAQQELNWLQTHQSNQLFFQLAQADSYHLQRRYHDQLNLLAQLQHQHRHSYTVIHDYAQALLENKKAKRATYLLEHFYWHYPQVDIDYTLLSHAQAQAGYLASAYQTRACAFLAYGAKEEALQQLNIAKKLVVNDPDQLAQITAQIKEQKDKL